MKTKIKYPSQMQYIESIAGKLCNSGITKSNYTKENAVNILSKVVLPNFCIYILNTFEDKIIKLLPL